MVREPIDQRDSARGVGKHRVPLPEGQVRRHHDGLLFVAAAHLLKQEVGGVRVIGQVADFVDRQERGAQIGPEAVLQGAGGLLAGEVQDQIGSGQETGRVARENRLVDEILGDHRLAEAV